MYKAIIFDLGKVLVHFDFKRGYQQLEGLCPYPAAEIPRRLGTTGLVERFETGLIEPRDFVAQTFTTSRTAGGLRTFLRDLELYL